MSKILAGPSTNKPVRSETSPNIMDGPLEHVPDIKFQAAATVWEVQDSPIVRTLGNYARYILRLRHQIERLEKSKKLTA